MFNRLGYAPDNVFRDDPKPSGSWRTLQPSTRAFPKIFIAGAQKSGTTSLFAYLAAHPAILPPQLKEPFYFGNDYRYAKGDRFYLPNFPLKKALLALGPQHGATATSIDASTNYLDHPHAAERIKKDVPDAKAIILLRNPVERAWSQYKMAVRMRFEGLYFEEALEKEAERIAEGKRLYPKHNYCRQRLGYRVRGEYAPMVENWMGVFGKDLLVLCAEDFFTDTPGVYRNVLDFLGLPFHDPGTFDKLNAGDGQKPMEEKTRQELYAHFRPHNEALEKLLNRSLPWKA